MDNLPDKVIYLLSNVRSAESHNTRSCQSAPLKDTLHSQGERLPESGSLGKRGMRSLQQRDMFITSLRRFIIPLGCEKLPIEQDRKSELTFQFDTSIHVCQLELAHGRPSQLGIRKGNGTKELSPVGRQEAKAELTRLIAKADKACSFT
jgi:hypothetical protein